MDNNDKYCSSDPTNGCNSSTGSIAALINSSNSAILVKLTSIDTKVGLISTEIDECCTETNANLVKIQDRFDTLIKNAENCCEAILDRLDTIIGIMQVPNAILTTITYTGYVCVQSEEVV